MPNMTDIKSNLCPTLEERLEMLERIRDFYPALAQLVGLHDHAMAELIELDHLAQIAGSRKGWRDGYKAGFGRGLVSEGWPSTMGPTSPK